MERKKKAFGNRKVTGDLDKSILKCSFRGKSSLKWVGRGGGAGDKEKEKKECEKKV